VVTPPLSAGVLPGITRGVVLRLADGLGMPTAEEDISPDRLLAADECFLTGTAAEVIAVTKIDGEPIGSGGPGAVTRKLSSAFREYIDSGDW
jgi:branched-chain amino acid aminotransferase